MTELAIEARGEGERSLRGLVARHPWRWFFLIALVPTAVVALGGSLLTVTQLNPDGFAVLAAVLVAWSCAEGERMPGRPAVRAVVFVLAFVALLALQTWGFSDVASVVLVAPTALFTAFALSGTFAGMPALRELARPLARLRASAAAWLVALLAWPLLCAIAIAASFIGAPAGVHGGGDWFPPRFVIGVLVTSLPAAIAWYGFAARRLLRSLSALEGALLVGLAPWLAVVLPLSVWSSPLHAFVLRTSLAAFALGVIAVWVLQRSRGSVVPVLLLLAAADLAPLVVRALSAPRVLGDGGSARLVAAEVAFALVLALQGRMWRRPATETAAASPPSGGRGA
jgi:hypothetical protein